MHFCAFIFSDFMLHITEIKVTISTVTVLSEAVLSVAQKWQEQIVYISLLA